MTIQPLRPVETRETPETPETPETTEPDERPRPDARKLKDLFQGAFAVRNVALTGLLVLASFYTLYFARSFLLPIVLAVLLALLLTPVVRGMKRLHIPGALAAAVVVLGLLGGVGFGVYELSGPAYEWMQKAPQSLRKVEARVREIKRPVQTIGRATEQVEKIAAVGAPKPAAVTVKAAPSLGQRLLSGTTELVAGAAVMIVLLYFLLASGDLFLRKLIKVLPSLADKRRAVEMARQVESEIATYLWTVTLINVGLGLAVWGAMAWIGLPNPLLWGVMATVTNYIPYLGAMICYVVFTLVGFLTFDDLAHSLLPVGAFLVLNMLEAYLFTPMVVGRRLTLNPVVIFLGLTFWGWLWGITGAVLAVPIMVVCKIFCDHIEPLAPIGEFLGD
jgi:predicted PurR-regulated permease PerM